MGITVKVQIGVMLRMMNRVETLLSISGECCQRSGGTPFRPFASHRLAIAKIPVRDGLRKP